MKNVYYRTEPDMNMQLGAFKTQMLTNSTRDISASNSMPVLNKCNPSSCVYQPVQHFSTKHQQKHITPLRHLRFSSEYSSRHKDRLKKIK